MKQSWQEMVKGTTTRSPTLRFSTADPTCSTMPMNSWPSTIGLAWGKVPL